MPLDVQKLCSPSAYDSVVADGLPPDYRAVLRETGSDYSAREIWRHLHEDDNPITPDGLRRVLGHLDQAIHERIKARTEEQNRQHAITNRMERLARQHRHAATLEMSPVLFTLNV